MGLPGSTGSSQCSSIWGPIKDALEEPKPPNSPVQSAIWVQLMKDCRFLDVVSLFLSHRVTVPRKFYHEYELHPTHTPMTDWYRTTCNGLLAAATVIS
jgi:hypothetical protein